jgi:type III pantothenate kinase
MTTSVVPKKYNFLKKTVIKKKIKIFEFKDKNILKDIKINLAKKNQVGSDRLTNAYGALNYYKKNCIIVDFGTTTTFDIADFRNIYQGGVIAPGISLSLTALNQFTAKLPLIKITKQKKVIGKDTKSAINSGVFLGYACLINGILNKIFHQTKKKYFNYFNWRILQSF